MCLWGANPWLRWINKLLKGSLRPQECGAGTPSGLHWDGNTILTTGPFLLLESVCQGDAHFKNEPLLPLHLQWWAFPEGYQGLGI